MNVKTEKIELSLTVDTIWKLINYCSDGNRDVNNAADFLILTGLQAMKNMTTGEASSITESPQEETA